MALAKSLQYLRDYVAIPSVNPMGRTDLPQEIAGEARLATHLQEQLKGMGFDAVCIGEGTRRSVVAEISVPEPIDTLLLASHIDTVPVDGMEIDPFDPVIEGGHLQGRGSCDTKAGMAAFIEALERVTRSGRLRRNVILLGEADEEFGSLGVRDTLAHFETVTGSSMRPDWVLATEPTNLRIVNAHKGVALVRLESHGRACHSSVPNNGRSALVQLAHAILALQEHATELEAHPHPLLGPPTLSIGLAGGGSAPNIVPESAWLQMDRRLLPGEGADEIRVGIETALQRSGVRDVEIASLSVEKMALETDSGHRSVRACQTALARTGLATEAEAVAFATDAGEFSDRGIPGIVFGPGSIEQAHTSREFISTSQVETATEVFVALLEGVD